MSRMDWDPVEKQVGKSGTTSHRNSSEKMRDLSQIISSWLFPALKLHSQASRMIGNQLQVGKLRLKQSSARRACPKFASESSLPT